MSVAAVYLDASALVKLVIAEPESPALIAYLASRPDRATSVISRIETMRAVARRGPTVPQLERVLERLVLIDLDAAVVARAAELEPPSVRTLDAIHLASALELREDLAGFVTYDSRLADAARAIGIEAVAPA